MRIGNCTSDTEPTKTRYMKTEHTTFGRQTTGRQQTDRINRDSNTRIRTHRFEHADIPEHKYNLRMIISVPSNPTHTFCNVLVLWYLLCLVYPIFPAISQIAFLVLCLGHHTLHVVPITHLMSCPPHSPCRGSKFVTVSPCRFSHHIRHHILHRQSSILTRTP